MICLPIYLEGNIIGGVNNQFFPLSIVWYVFTIISDWRYRSMHLESNLTWYQFFFSNYEFARTIILAFNNTWTNKSSTKQLKDHIPSQNLIFDIFVLFTLKCNKRARPVMDLSCNLALTVLLYIKIYNLRSILLIPVSAYQSPMEPPLNQDLW